MFEGCLACRYINKVVKDPFLEVPPRGPLKITFFFLVKKAFPKVADCFNVKFSKENTPVVSSFKTSCFLTKPWNVIFVPHLKTKRFMNIFFKFAYCFSLEIFSFERVLFLISFGK